MLRIKRVYEPKSGNDGKRIYVDRLWPRGLRSSEAAIDEWLKDISPSDDLRKWFGHDPEKFPEFRKRYLKELAAPIGRELTERIAREANKKVVTLLYSARDTEHNNAIVIADQIKTLMKGKQRI